MSWGQEGGRGLWCVGMVAARLVGEDFATQDILEVRPQSTYADSGMETGTDSGKDLGYINMYLPLFAL